MITTRQNPPSRSAGFDWGKSWDEVPGTEYTRRFDLRVSESESRLPGFSVSVLPGTKEDSNTDEISQPDVDFSYKVTIDNVTYRGCFQHALQGTEQDFIRDCTYGVCQSFGVFAAPVVPTVRGPFVRASGRTKAFTEGTKIRWWINEDTDE
ncbi:MAG: hypothetical protein R3F11_10305 [Verrucomicrobiales bacterium]